MIKTEEKTEKWYTIKVQNNRERTISEKLKFEMMREFGEEVDFLIPTKETISIKEGKKVQREQILYPGYIFVETNSIDKIAHLVKITNGATNVLRDSKGDPIILRKSEVDRMIGERESNKSFIGSPFLPGEKVEIVNGPFSNFNGKIESIDIEKNKVKVEVIIFGRSSAVDLTLEDIIKFSK